jgi:hypothetical protein
VVEAAATVVGEEVMVAEEEEEGEVAVSIWVMAVGEEEVGEEVVVEAVVSGDVRLVDGVDELN